MISEISQRLVRYRMGSASSEYLEHLDLARRTSSTASSVCDSIDFLESTDIRAADLSLLLEVQRGRSLVVMRDRSERARDAERIACRHRREDATVRTHREGILDDTCERYTSLRLDS